MSSFLDLSFSENAVNAAGKSVLSVKTPSAGRTLSNKITNEKNTPLSAISASSSVGFSDQSVFTSIEAARASRLKNAAKIVQKVGERKTKWKREKEWKKKRNIERQEERMRQIETRCEVMSQQRKNAIGAQQDFLDDIKTAERDMVRSRLETCRSQRQIIEKTSKDKKRQSIMVRTKIRDESQRNLKTMDMQKKSDEQYALEISAVDCRDVAEARREEEVSRRLSMANRQEVGRQQKLVEVDWQRSQQLHEKSLIESRREGWQDMREAKANEAELRRQSMAGRVLKADVDAKAENEKHQREMNDSMSLHAELRQTDIEDKEKETEKERNIHIKEVDFANEMFLSSKAIEAAKHDQDLKDTTDRCKVRSEFQIDDQTTKKQLEELRRKSLNFRGLQHRYHMKLAEGEKQFLDTLREEDESLKAMDRLAKQEYVEDMKEAERQEMEYRTLEHHIHRQIEDGQQALRHEVQNKQRELCHGDIVAMNEAASNEQKRSRESLQDRLYHAKMGRDIDEQVRQDNIAETHDIAETRRIMSKNRKDYQADLRKRARESLAARRVYGQQQNETELEEMEVILQGMEESRELDEEARQDMLDYLERSRMEDETAHLTASFMI